MHRRERRNLSLLIALVALAIYCRAALAAEAFTRQFSADMISHSGRDTVQAKLYVSGEKMRTEMAGNIVITRLDRNVAWIIMPAQQLYMEQPIDRKMLPKTSRELEGEVERLSLGKETIDGRQTEKFKVTYNEGASQVSVYQWLMDSGFPVKIEAVDGSWSVEHKNISLGSQPDALFEPPSGYQKVALPFAGGSGAPSLGEVMSQAGANE